jgi:hypothetical protein
MKRAIYFLAVLTVIHEFAYAEEPLFAGMVQSVSYEVAGKLTVFTRESSGATNVTTRETAKEITSFSQDVWVKVYQNWVMIDLKRKKTDFEIAIPREQIREIIIGNGDRNKLPIQSQGNQ